MNLWDMLLLVGVGCVVAGIAWIYWPVALIVFGLSCVTIAILHEKGSLNVPQESNSDQPTGTPGGDV